MQDIKLLFGPPQTLTDRQTEALGRLQRATLAYAETIEDVVPQTEDRERALQTLKDAQLLGEKAIRFGYNILTHARMRQLFQPIHARDEIVDRAWFNHHNFCDLLKWGVESGFDPESQREALQRGVYGTLWTTEIRVSKKIPQGLAYLIGSNDGDDDLQPDWTPTLNKLVVI